MKKSALPSQSLSKYLAQAGVASRRKAVELIEEGAVAVNGKIVTEPGYKLKETDSVTCNGKLVRSEKRIYILLNKPRNYITTTADEKGRKTILDLLPASIKTRLFPVGRLDRDTTGLLLITNDGHLAQLLAHPRYEVEKVYAATLDRLLRHEDLQVMKQGIHLKDGFIKVDDIRYVKDLPRNHVKVTLHSGKNRIVRRIFESFGYDVKRLDRLEYAGLTKKGLPVGGWRYLTDGEIKRLLK